MHSSSDLTPLAQILLRWRAQTGTPGVSSAVRIDGELVWQASSGLDTIGSSGRFPIYSITKTLTAICILHLVEAAAFSLDDRASTWFPALEIDPRITIRQLLQHTSGLRDYGSSSEYHDAVRSRPLQPWSDHEFFDAVLKQALLFAPGTGWSYSNIGFMLLRLIVQQPSRMSFRKCVDEWIVKPLSLRDTFIAETIADWKSCVIAQSASVAPNSQRVDVRAVYHPGWCAPGVAVSTPADVTAILDAVFSGRLVTPTMRNEMLSLVPVPGNHPPAVSPSSGLGILADPDGSHGASFGHGGAGPGYQTEVTIFPKARDGHMSVATFINCDGPARAMDAQQEVLRWVRDEAGASLC